MSLTKSTITTRLRKRRPGDPWISKNRVLNGGLKLRHTVSLARNPNFDADETKVLIQLWGDPKVQRQLITTHKKHNVIVELSAKMEEYGYFRTPEEIATRIKNLKCIYNRLKKEVDSGECQQPSWRHYGEMDAVMSRPIFSVRPNEVPAPSIRYQIEQEFEQKFERQKNLLDEITVEEDRIISDSEDELLTIPMDRRNSLLTPMKKDDINSDADAQVSANTGNNYDQIYINNENVNGEKTPKYCKIIENTKTDYNKNQAKHYTLKAPKCYNSSQDNLNICPNNNSNNNKINNNDSNDIAADQNNYENSISTVYTKSNNKTTSNTIKLLSSDEKKAANLLDHRISFEKGPIYNDRTENTIATDIKKEPTCTKSFVSGNYDCMVPRLNLQRKNSPNSDTAKNFSNKSSVQSNKSEEIARKPLNTRRRLVHQHDQDVICLDGSSSDFEELPKVKRCAAENTMTGKGSNSGGSQTDRLTGLTLLQTSENGQQRSSIPNINSGPPLRILSSRRGQQVPCVFLNTSVGTTGLPQNVGQNVNTVINPTSDTHRGGMHLLLVPTEQLVQQRVANIPRAISSNTNQPSVRIENSDVTSNNNNTHARNISEPNTRFSNANNNNSKDYCLGVGAQNFTPHILETLNKNMVELLAIQHDNNSLQYERLNIERERLDIDRKVGTNLIKMISNHLMWEEKMFEYIFRSGRTDSFNQMEQSSDNNYCNNMPSASSGVVNHGNKIRVMPNNIKTNGETFNETSTKTILERGKAMKASNVTINTNVSTTEPRPHTSKKYSKFTYEKSPKQVQKRRKTGERSVELDQREQEFKADQPLKKESGQSLSSHLSDISNSD